jgi:hypothetical protein
MSTDFCRLRDPISRIDFADNGEIWLIYYKSPKEIDPPAFEGERLLCKIDMSQDENDILYQIVTNLFFGREEVDRVAHRWWGGSEDGKCLMIYGAHLPDDTLLLSDYSEILTLKKLKDDCKTIKITERRIDG